LSSSLRSSTTSSLIEPLESRTLLHASAVYLDAGGGPYTDSSGIIYAKDFGFTGGQSGTQPFAVANTGRDALYITRRWGKSFSYHLPVENGDYTLRLRFVEPAWNSTGMRVFDVSAEGKLVLDNFDIRKEAGFRTAATRPFAVTIADGALDLKFTASVDNAIVSAIELIPAHGIEEPPPPPVDNGTITWKNAAPNPQARFEGQGAVVNGKLYVFGGFYNSSVQATTRSDVYDPATNTWTRIKDMPEKITHAAVVVKGTTIYIMGGFVGDHPAPATNHIWKYDTRTNTYIRGSNLPSARGSGAAALIGGRYIHFFGGVNQNRTSDQRSHWVLDTTTGKWVTHNSYPIGASHLAAIELNGKIYAMGGEQGLDEAKGNVSTVYVYDPVTDAWTKKASMPVAKSHFSSSIFIRNGRIITIGGSGNGGTNGVPQSEVAEYNPATNTWRTLTSLPMALKTPVAALINGKIIATTGNASGAAIPVANTWVGTIA
jgi:N-acetylneuraminic acid mutarotase